MKMSEMYNSLINSIIIITLISLSKNEESKKFPLSSSILNPKHIFICKDGIHFFDSKLNENKHQFISLSNSSKEDNYKTTMIQFSNKDGGYILILVINIIYIFKQDGSFISSIDLSKIIKGDYYYSITPYKNEDNNLHYIISFIDKKNKKIFLHHFIFSIPSLSNEIKNLKEFEIKIRQTNKSPDDIEGTTCLFIFSPIINDTVLACIYEVIFPFEIHIRIFNPNNNFNELNDNFHYFLGNNSIFKNISPYISGITHNLDKTKIFIYFINEGHPFWLTFDFENKFSNYKEYKNVKLNGYYPLNNIFYLNKKQEIIAFSRNENYQMYILIFNLKYELKYNGIFRQNSYNFNDFDIIYLNEQYFVFVNNSINNEDRNNLIKNFRHLDGDNKCKTSSLDSSLYGLCTLCNTDDGYYPTAEPIKDTYYQCFKENSNPKNFYYDSNSRTFNLCYETCLTCDGPGDDINNNCLTCDNNHIKKPEFSDSKNCVTRCVYSYYYTPYGYYKCNNSSNCPEESSLYVKELNKCTHDCNKEDKYIYQYSGMCLMNCPENTEPNSENICIEQNIESCSKSESEIDLQDFLTSGGVDSNAKIYAKEFGYTGKHVSYYYNNLYSILLYQDSSCIEELSIDMPKIDFGSCYTKVQESLKGIKEKIIIGLVEKLNGQQKSKISYFFYHPETGEKLDADAICKDEEIIIKESVLSQLNSSSSGSDLETVLFLTEQSINIFDKLDAFYTDICYHYESPNGKDIPLKERIRIYYPNITICDVGCTNKGVDLNTLESICECKFGNILNNDLLEENALIKGTLGEIKDLIGNSNLDVLKCYKDAFNKEYFLKNVGSFIIITILVLQLIFAIIFLSKDMSKIRKYLYDISEAYINLIKKNVKNENTEKKHQIKIKEPPKKTIQNHKNKKISSKNVKSGLSQKSDAYLSKRKLSPNSPQLLKSKIHIKNTLKNEDTENSNKPFDLEEYLKTDFDDMEYDDAIKNDKRTFCDFYIERLKTKQMIADTFYNKDNIRPFSIKIILFLLNIDLYFSINGLFFSEEYIIELYHLKTEDTFFSFLPRSIGRFFYTTMVSVIVSIIIDCIFIEEKKIKRILIREKEDIFQLKYEIALTSKSIKTRYIIFIILCFVISLGSWYYVNCFNNVYKGLKVEWIKSSITIIIIMQILSMLVALLEAIIRELSFEWKSEKLYKFKKFLS